MKQFIILLTFLYNCLPLSASEPIGIVLDQAQVKSIKYQKETNEYKVVFENRAAYYKAGKNHFECLSKSLREKKAVQFEFNMKTLSISSCK